MPGLHKPLNIEKKQLLHIFLRISHIPPEKEPDFCQLSDERDKRFEGLACVLERRKFAVKPHRLQLFTRLEALLRLDVFILANILNPHVAELLRAEVGAVFLGLVFR